MFRNLQRHELMKKSKEYELQIKGLLHETAPYETMDQIVPKIWASAPKSEKRGWFSRLIQPLDDSQIFSATMQRLGVGRSPLLVTQFLKKPSYIASLAS